MPVYSTVLFAINEPGAHIFQTILQKDIEVRLLITRKCKSAIDTLPHNIATQEKIPWTYIETFSDDVIERIKHCAPDFVISGWFHLRVPEAVITLSQYCSVNLHPSLLPAYRGPSPVEWCIMNGETETGLTLHQLEKEFDTGDILWQQSVPILPDETAGEVLQKILFLVPGAIEDLLLRASKGDYAGAEQKTQLASYYPKWTIEDTRIHWGWNAIKIHNRVRALQPRSIARIKTGDVEYNIASSFVTERYDYDKPPGTILDVQDGGRSVKVVCGDYRVIDLRGLDPFLTSVIEYD